MLQISMTVQDKTVPLPAVRPGKSGSMTDISDNTLILFTCDQNGQVAAIYRSVAGIHAEVGDQREIHSFNRELLSILRCGEGFELDITTPYGPTKLSFDLAGTPH